MSAECERRRKGKRWAQSQIAWISKTGHPWSHTGSPWTTGSRGSSLPASWRPLLTFIWCSFADGQCWQEWNQPTSNLMWQRVYSPWAVEVLSFWLRMQDSLEISPLMMPIQRVRMAVRNLMMLIWTMWWQQSARIAHHQASPMDKEYPASPCSEAWNLQRWVDRWKTKGLGRCLHVLLWRSPDRVRHCLLCQQGGALCQNIGIGLCLEFPEVIQEVLHQGDDVAGMIEMPINVIEFLCLGTGLGHESV